VSSGRLGFVRGEHDGEESLAVPIELGWSYTTNPCKSRTRSWTLHGHLRECPIWKDDVRGNLFLAGDRPAENA